MWGYHVIVPPQGRATVLQELHGAYPGMTRMKSLACGIVWWPKLDDEIELMVRSCSVCQTQSDNPPVAPLIPWQCQVGHGIDCFLIMQVLSWDIMMHIQSGLRFSKCRPPLPQQQFSV